MWGQSGPVFPKPRLQGEKGFKIKPERQGVSSRVERRGISMNDYNMSGQQHANVHVPDSLDLEIPGKHVVQLLLRGSDRGGGRIWPGRMAMCGTEERRGDGKQSFDVWGETRSKRGPFLGLQQYL